MRVARVVDESINGALTINLGEKFTMRMLRRVSPHSRTLVAGLLGALALAALAPWASATTLSASLVPKYVDPLPRVCGGTATPDCIVMTPTASTAVLDRYDIAARPFYQQILPAKDIYGNPFNKTPVWGFGPNITGTPVCLEGGSATSCFHYPAASILATVNRPVQVNWLNQLVDGVGNPVTYPPDVPVKGDIHWANPSGICDDGRHQTDCNQADVTYTGPVPIIVHLHGVLGVTEASDGIPEAWFLPASSPGFVGFGSDYCHVSATVVSAPNGVRDCTHTPGAALFQYPNTLTGPNQVQPATMLFFHDHTLGATLQNIYMGLVGAYVLTGGPLDVPAGTLPSGDYDIPLVIQDKAFNLDGSLKAADVGNIQLVNGKTWPYLNVEPRKYRFRIVNGGAANYLKLRFNALLSFTQIGGDQGFLPNPQLRGTLLIAPGERLDTVVDFRGLNGRTLTLQTDSVGVMQFRVGASASGDTGPVPSSLPVQPALAQAATAPAVQVALFDSLLGTFNPTTGASAPLRWDDATTEFPSFDSAQVWEIYNAASQDSHPIHLHEVEFKVLNRQSISATGPCATPCGPRAGETGFKDTVIADQGQITRVLVNFHTAHAGLFAWHCHITPHEDDEMMRPMCIINPVNPPANPALDGFAGCPTE